MRLLDYIKGQRKGKDAHQIEKDSMTDPFLYEAIEGFDSIDDNHAERISNIQNRLKANSKTKSGMEMGYRKLWQTAAAIVIIIFGLGGYLLTDYHKSNLQAQELGDNAIIDIYVPEAYYTENIATIAQRNSVVARAYKPAIQPFEIEQKRNALVSDEELGILSEEATEENTIDIYVPENFRERIPSSNNGKPEPVCGHEKYDLYLKNSMKRPTDDSCKDRKGKVIIEFSVDEQGQPYLFEIRQSVCGTSDNEAIRLIKSGPRWTLGHERAVIRVFF